MKIVVITALFSAIAVAFAPSGGSFGGNQNQGQSTQIPGRLPMQMRDITLPHTFTVDEMEAIRARLRAFSLELQTFSGAARLMSLDQLQLNFAQAIWPIVKCMMQNQDGQCPGNQ